MIKYYKHLILIVLFGVTIFQALAQENPVDSLSTGNFKIHSVTLTTSTYNPEMDFFNSELLPLLEVNDAFDSNYALGASVTFEMNKIYRGRLGFSLWKDDVQGADDLILRSLEVKLYRFQVAGIIAPEQLSVNDFQPYAGIETGFIMIRNKTNMDNNLPKQKGKDFCFAPLAGIEFSAGRFITALEFKYNLGSYVQDLTDNVGLSMNNVSINGPELQFSIGYKFTR